MILRERGPILQARPIRNPAVGVLYSDPLSGERARQLFENIMRQRLERFGAAANFALASLEEEASIGRALQHLVRTKPTVVLVASTTAPAGPGRRCGPGSGAHRLPHGAVPGAGRAREPAAAGLQGRRTDCFRARLLPVREGQRGGYDSAADAGAVPGHRLGNRVSRAWRAPGLTSSSITSDRNLRAARRCSSGRAPRQRPASFSSHRSSAVSRRPAPCGRSPWGTRCRLSQACETVRPAQMASPCLRRPRPMAGGRSLPPPRRSDILGFLGMLIESTGGMACAAAGLMAYGGAKPLLHSLRPFGLARRLRSRCDRPHLR